MKRMLALVLSICILLVLGGCDVESSHEKSGSGSEHSESSSQSQVESISSIIDNAMSVKYKINDEWISADIDSPEAKDFIHSLTDLFPEQFGEVAAAYMPEDIIIKINFQESTEHSVNVNSSASSVEQVSISTIEIDINGNVFLIPQGVALGAIENVETVLTASN